MVGSKDILGYVENVAPRSVNAVEIANHFGMSYSAANVALWRLWKAKEIIRTKTRGYYQSKDAALTVAGPFEDFRRLRFHAIEALVECKKLPGEGFRRIERIVTTRYGSPSTRRNPRNRSRCFDDEWLGRPMTIQLTTREKLQVSLRASVDPLDPMEYLAYLYTLPHTFGIPEPLWTVRFEANEDHKATFKPGVMEWRTAVGFVKVYWKEVTKRTRVEAGTYSELTFEEMSASLGRVVNAMMELGVQGGPGPEVR